MTMKVVHLETGKHLYGGARQVVYLLSGLKGYPDCSNELVCARGGEIHSGCREVADTVHPLAMRGDLDPVFFLRLIRLLKRVRPDLIHVHSRRGADIWGGLAAGICRVPALLSRRVDNPESRLAVESKYRLYQRVVTISRGISRVLIAEGVPREKVVCVPSAVDADHFQSKCDRKWFGAEFGIKEDEPVVGVIAQLIERKGHRYLLEALPRIVAQHPMIRILFFGQGPLQASLEQRVQGMGLEDRVAFCGFRADLHRILPCLHLVVHPALMEGLGVSLLQAAAAGVPLVAARVGGIPEIVRDGYNGLLVEPGDQVGLAEAVITLLREKELRREFGCNGQQLVREDFSVESMVAGNYAVYADVLSV